MYHQFNIHQLYVLPSQCIYVFFFVDLRTNSDTTLTDCFYNRYLTLCSPAVTICTTSLTFNNSTFCPHSVFLCFVWIWEQTAISSLYSVNWLVFITENDCVYCAVRAGSLYIMRVNFHLAYRVRSEATQFQICGAQSGIWTVVRLSPVGAAHRPPSTCCWSSSHSTQNYCHLLLVCKRLQMLVKAPVLYIS